MPRYHDIWDATQQAQVRVQFTPEEETAQDAFEVQSRIDHAAAAAEKVLVQQLVDKLAADTITLPELRELARRDRGLQRE